MIEKLLLGGIAGSVVGVGVAYGIASLPCPLTSKGADKVCYVRAFNKSLDAWRIGCLGSVIIGLTVSNRRRRFKFQPMHLSMVGVLVLVGAVAVNNKSLGFGISNTQSRFQLNNTNNLSPRMSAFLATIRWAETGTSDKSSYNKLVFNSTFNDFSTHPKIKQCAPINGRRVCSTAAGAYQMLDISWNDVAPKLGLKDFTPPSQDRMAIEYIRRNKAIDDVESGNVEMAFCKVGKVWASLICNNYNQNPRTTEELKNYYNKQLIAAGGEPVSGESSWREWFPFRQTGEPQRGIGFRSHPVARVPPVEGSGVPVGLANPKEGN
ncbi:hypothetical protein NIES4071_103340 (plasmid) [Calothrix sp. NIES-4071]|nr:hypothetical protein NIES4071_103340 [Calothrix sp. NIES-4071]BAZ64715.1 hypothetical protein NIES4105_104480 [Calothrix sp. NIES-4105]